MKTIGQRLYEIKHPKYIRVVSASNSKFATSDDVLSVPNPVHHVPWNLLTEKCRQDWEAYAVGHHLVSGGAA